MSLWHFFKYFAELFAGKSYIRLRQTNHVDDMSQFLVMCYTECIEKLEFRGHYWLCLVILQQIGKNFILGAKINTSM